MRGDLSFYSDKLTNPDIWAYATNTLGDGSGLKITDEVRNEVTYQDLKELVGLRRFIWFEK
jgi:hypothetical protein